MRWGRSIVVALFALAGAIGLGRGGAHALFGADPPRGGGGSGQAASAQSAQPSSADPAANAPADPLPDVQVASAPDTSAADSSAPPPLDFESHRAAAEEELKARMPEIEGLQYRDVKTSIGAANGQPTVDFCGEVNSLNPMGVYVGFQKFISSRFDARIEQGTAPGEFAQAWAQRCNGTEGPKIWN